MLVGRDGARSWVAEVNLYGWYTQPTPDERRISPANTHLFEPGQVELIGPYYDAGRLEWRYVNEGIVFTRAPDFECWITQYAISVPEIDQHPEFVGINTLMIHDLGAVFYLKPPDSISVNSNDMPAFTVQK